MHRPARHLLLAAAALALVSCKTTAANKTTPETPEQTKAVAALQDGKPASLHWWYRNIVIDGKRDAVLNWMRIGKDALDLGRLDLAAEAFDNALAGIEAVYADNPQAEKARSVWHAEAEKDFKGEPHERAMAYYYRGLVSMMQGDYENARASFKGAMLQDSFAENERHRADFAVAAFLEGWTNQCTGSPGRADENFKEAAEARGTVTPPAPQDRLLVLVEAGAGPSKEAVGQHKEKLAYREQNGPKGGYQVRVARQRHALRLAEELFFQATTRGGREMDKILAMKAGTKEATATAGAVGVATGLGVMANANRYNYGNGNNGGAAMAAGAMIALIGLMAHAAAQNMTAEVDTRYWYSLPHSVFLATLPPARITGPDGIDILHDNGASAITNRDAIRIATGRDCTIVWVPASALSLDAPAAPPAEEPPAKPTSAKSGKSAGIAVNSPEPTAGNCRTQDGPLVNLEPERCAAINGTTLSSVPAKG
ncbi:MAG TPA: hypothetical protein VGE72_29915 [Azospirillum sp.]